MKITGFSFIKEKITSFCRRFKSVNPPPPLPPPPPPPPTLPPSHVSITMGWATIGENSSSQPPTIYSDSVIHQVDQSSSGHSFISIEDERLSSSSSSSPNHPFRVSLSSSTETSNSTTSIFTLPTHEKQLIICLPFQFRYYNELHLMSFTVLVGLFGADYERVNGHLVPAMFFKSHPILFNVFVVLIFFTFNACVIGKGLRGRHDWINKYLFPSAFSSLMVALYIYMWDLLPGDLKWIPYILFGITFLVMLTLFIRGYKKKNIQDESTSNANGL